MVQGAPKPSQGALKVSLGDNQRAQGASNALASERLGPPSGLGSFERPEVIQSDSHGDPSDPQGHKCDPKGTPETQGTL